MANIQMILKEEIDKAIELLVEVTGEMQIVFTNEKRSPIKEKIELIERQEEVSTYNMGLLFDYYKSIIKNLEEGYNFLVILECYDVNHLIQKIHDTLTNNIIEDTTKIYIDMMNAGTDDDSYRVCSVTGEIMIEGYLIEDGLEYYKDKEALLKSMTWEEFEMLYDNGDGNSYYTNWYE